MKIAILITGHVRESLKYDNLVKIINEIKKKGECDIFCYTSNKKEHSTKTWYELNKNMQNEYVEYDELKEKINFKKIEIYQEKEYSEIERNILWGKSPISFVGVKSLFLNINKCLELVEEKYDYIFRLRFDYYKFDYAKYTDDIIQTIINLNLFDDTFWAVRVKDSRGEDSFFCSKFNNFTRVIKFIVDNFEDIEKNIKQLNYYFMPEDLINFACLKQDIKYFIV